MSLTGAKTALSRLSSRKLAGVVVVIALAGLERPQPSRGGSFPLQYVVTLWESESISGDDSRHSSQKMVGELCRKLADENRVVLSDQPYSSVKTCPESHNCEVVGIEEEQGDESVSYYIKNKLPEAPGNPHPKLRKAPFICQLDANVKIKDCRAFARSELVSKVWSHDSLQHR